MATCASECACDNSEKFPGLATKTLLAGLRIAKVNLWPTQLANSLKTFPVPGMWTRPARRAASVSRKLRIF